MPRAVVRQKGGKRRIDRVAEIHESRRGKRFDAPKLHRLKTRRGIEMERSVAGIHTRVEGQCGHAREIQRQGVSRSNRRRISQQMKIRIRGWRHVEHIGAAQTQRGERVQSAVEIDGERSRRQRRGGDLDDVAGRRRAKRRVERKIRRSRV